MCLVYSYFTIKVEQKGLLTLLSQYADCHMSVSTVYLGHRHLICWYACGIRGCDTQDRQTNRNLGNIYGLLDVPIPKPAIFILLLKNVWFYKGICKLGIQGILGTLIGQTSHLGDRHLLTLFQHQ